MDDEHERSLEPEQQEIDEQYDEPATKARKPRKRKAKAMEAHLFGLSADEKAAILASIVDSPGPATRVSHDTSFAAEEEEPEPPKKEPTQPPEVIAARQKVLRTSWRLAAFSHFSATFPHLVAKDFDIDKLEADLDGTDENSYIGEVVSRLLYTLTRDSRLAGKEPDKPWLFSLRREYLKYDPAHNPLGTWPLYAEEEYPAEASSTISTPQDSAEGGTADATKPGSTQTQQPVALVPRVGQGPLSAVPVSHTAGEAGNPDAMDVDDKEGGAERRTSKGWEDLTLEQKIYSLWSICEWQLTNPEKFKTFLTKPLPEEHQVVWRIDPIGTDSKHNVYWLFDDNRLWVERESPQKRELRLIYEEAQQKNMKKQAAREKRLLANQRKRMKALHEARRLRMEAKRIQDEKERKELEAIHAKIKAEGGTIPVQASPNGKKRKRAGSQSGEGSDDEDFEIEGGGGRTSSRLGKARLHERMAARPPRRKSTRTASSTDLAADGVVDDEDWQKIPADWLKTEDQERNEDPDFGEDAAENEEDVEADDVGSDSGLSNLEDDEELAKAANVRASARNVSRRSPRKANDTLVKAEAEESELSPLSGGEDEDFEVSEEEEPEEEDGQTYPDSKYNMGPSFENEDKDMPEGFVKWESLCTNLEEWEAFPARFAGTKNANELALLDYINNTVIPGVRAAYEVIAEERRRKEEAERAYLMRQRKEAERKAAKEAAKEAAKAAKAAGVPALTSKALRGVRSTRSKASTATPTDSLGVQQDSRANLEVSDTRASGLDRRAARAQQREEEKRAREEAELMAALQASQPPQAEEELASAPLDDEAGLDTEPLRQAPAGDDADYQPDAANEVIYNENGEVMVPIIYADEEDDYFLDCSICKKRGINLDADLQLVQCDTCERWEHIACHREADKKAGRPRRNFDVEDFYCEDCEGVGHQAIKIIPKASKRERSDAQKIGAAKGAEKRKAKTEERRLERAAIEAATGKKPPARKRAQPLEKELYKPVARTTKRSRQSGASELGNDTVQSQDETMQDEEDASVMEQDEPTLQLNGSSAALDTTRPPVSQGSDIPIDPSLASRVSSPLPQAPMATSGSQPVVPLPSFLQAEEASQALPALSSNLAEVPIPGLAQPTQGNGDLLDPLLASGNSNENGLQQ